MIVELRDGSRVPKPCIPWLFLSDGLLAFKKVDLALAATSSYLCAYLKGGSNDSFPFGEQEWRGHVKKGTCVCGKKHLLSTLFSCSLWY